MKLKYVGDHSPIVIRGVKNKEGGIGFSVVKGEIFEVEAQIGLDLMSKFNEKGKKPKFIEASNAGRPPKSPEVENKKMIDEAPIKK